MGGSLPRPDEHQQEEGRTRWTRPALTYLGNLRDIVHGFGKSTDNMDSDPNMTRKAGTG